MIHFSISSAEIHCSFSSFVTALGSSLKRPCNGGVGIDF
jgi:hypothetical protein